MSIDLSDKEFGYKLFYIKSSLRTPFRRKEYKTDENGIEWFRYNEERHVFECKKYTYCGKQTVVSVGETDGWEEGTEYYVKDSDGNVTTFYDYVTIHENVNAWYEKEEEALSVIEKLREIDRLKDRE